MKIDYRIYFLLGLIFAGLSFYLSLECVIARAIPPDDVVGGVDIAADGGALGFALLSGICFICHTYLSKKNA